LGPCGGRLGVDPPGPTLECSLIGGNYAYGARGIDTSALITAAFVTTAYVTGTKLMLNQNQSIYERKRTGRPLLLLISSNSKGLKGD